MLVHSVVFVSTLCCVSVTSVLCQYTLSCCVSVHAVLCVSTCGLVCHCILSCVSVHSVLCVHMFCPAVCQYTLSCCVCQYYPCVLVHCPVCVCQHTLYSCVSVYSVLCVSTLLCVSVHSVLFVCVSTLLLLFCVSTLLLLCVSTICIVSVHPVLLCVSTLCLVVCQYTRPESLLLERDLLGLPSTSTALHANSPHAAAFSFLPAEVCPALLGNHQLSISDRCNKAIVHCSSTGTVSKAAMDNPLNTHCNASQCFKTQSVAFSSV